LAAHQQTSHPRRVLVVIGPSASGKSSLTRELHRRGVIRVHPTWTDRPRRDDERNGSVEHRFVSRAAFDRLCARSFFLETAALPGLPYRYGLPALPPPAGGAMDAVILRAPFVDRLARRFPEQLVYQLEDTAQLARARLLSRGCAPAELAARLDDHHGEIEAGRRVAHRVVVNDRPLDALADTFAAALHADMTGGFP
jgi:guanylate kinase